MQRTDAGVDATQQTARELLQEASSEIRNIIETGPGTSAKPPVLEKFAGTHKEDVAQWLFNVEQYFEATKIREERQKVHFGASLL